MINLASILQSPYYYFNISSLLPFIFFSIALFFSMFILGIGSRLSFHRSISYFYMSSALWFLGFALSLNAWVDPVTFFWGRIVFLGIVLVPVTLLHLSIVVTNRYRYKRFFLWIAYFGVFVLFLKTWLDPFFIGIEEYPWGFSPKAKGAQLIFVAFSVVCFAYAFLMILFHYLKSLRSPQRRKSDLQYRRKLEFVMVSFILTVLSNVTVLNNYGISIYPFGPVSLFLAIIMMSYALIKYHNVTFLEEMRKMGNEMRQKDEEVVVAKQNVESVKLKLVDMGRASIFASLSAGILHQICQPITAMHGLVKFMKNGMKKEDPYYKSVDLIFEQSSYLKEMLNNLMDLMRHREMDKKRVDLNLCMDRALNLVRDELRIKRVNWDFFPEKKLPLVHADAIHIQETFMNIIINALDVFVRLPKEEKRYVKIFSGFDSTKNEVFVIIENSGSHLSKEEIKVIFDPFVSGREDGTGIGLSLCKDLICENGGDVSVENIQDKTGKGVRFFVKFPAVED